VDDASSLWRWVRYYINNWRLHPSQTQSVRDALAQSYWQGDISWRELLRCERLLGKAAPNTPADEHSAKDLSLALAKVGSEMNGYKLIDIRGFIDQGIVFAARKGSDFVDLLCSTRTPNPVYTKLPTLIGQPLCVWLMAQYPTGLPLPLAQMLLQQIYQLLLNANEDIIDSIHPGQFFIDTDTLQLQHIPYTSPIQPYMRGQLYEGGTIGRRLIACAYELFTACVPTGDELKTHQILKACPYLQLWQKKQIERCLNGRREISLSQAALVLDANKKYIYRDRALLAFASVFALAAIVWQGINYAPVMFTSNEVVPETIIMQQSMNDSHINLLKAAFFTQIEENNFAGAKVSWQALQKILPKDDVFIKEIGPELLSKEVTQIRRAPVRKPIISELPAIPEFDDEILALPPLPKQEMSKALESIIESVVAADPCEQNGTCVDMLSNNETGPRLLVTQTQENKPLVITQQTISVADYNKFCMATEKCMPHETPAVLDLELTDIESTVEDYNNYCLTTGSCEPLETQIEPAHLSVKQIEAYASWLSEETGFKYRLATEHDRQDTAHSTSNKNKNQIAFYLVRENTL
jgi:hypothetical protein